MAFDWNQYPADGDYAAPAPPPYLPPIGGMSGGEAYPNADDRTRIIDGPISGQTSTGDPYSWDPSKGPLNSGLTFDPSKASPTTGINGGGGAPNTPAAVPASSGGDPQAFFNQLFPGASLSPQDLAAHEAELNAHGIKLIRNAAGQPGKIQLADGTVIDPIIGAGSGQNQKAWNVVAGPGGVPTGGGGGRLNSFGQQYGFMTSPIAQFTPPSAADALASPGSQYAIDEAQRTMQNSAAAKGTLLNGRVLQAQNNAILNQAAGQYGDVFNRALQTYGTNYQTQTGNQDRPFNKLYSLSELGQRAAAGS